MLKSSVNPFNHPTNGRQSSWKKYEKITVSFRDFRLISLMIENKIIEMYPSSLGAWVQLKSCYCLVKENYPFCKLSRFNPPLKLWKKVEKICRTARPVAKRLQQKSLREVVGIVIVWSLIAIVGCPRQTDGENVVSIMILCEWLDFLILLIFRNKHHWLTKDGEWKGKNQSDEQWRTSLKSIFYRA